MRFRAFLLFTYMAVFTAVTKTQLMPWLQAYTLGSLVDLRGIESGIENSNFFLTTDQGEYVLTLFEKLRASELSFYLQLMQHLANHQVRVPKPITRLDGTLFGELNGKPAAIVTKLEGSVQLTPTEHHCAEIGSMLALMHQAGSSFTLQQPNLRSLSWWQATVPTLLPFLGQAQRELLLKELAFQQAFFASEDYLQMPGGPCHCDLFRDNVLFAPASNADEHDKLSGFFDFYFAGNDKWLFDIAVCVNDWCIDLATGQLDNTRTTAFLQAYARVRPFTVGEQSNWRTMLRAAALRFWISRLYDFYLPRSATLLKAHDPTHFERILLDRIDSPTLAWV